MDDEDLRSVCEALELEKVKHAATKVSTLLLVRMCLYG